MAKIKPRFDFSAAVAQVGTGQSHTSAQIPDNNLAPVKFNEYERVMVAICTAIGETDLSDILIGSEPTIESAFRTLVNKTNIEFASVSSQLSAFQASIVAMDAKVTSNFSNAQQLISNEAAYREAADTSLQQSINALNTLIINANSSTLNLVNNSVSDLRNDITALQNGVVYKASGSQQTIADPIIFSNTVSFSAAGTTPLDAGTNPIRTMYTPSISSDLINKGYADNRYVHTEGNGRIHGDLYLTGKLIGGFPVGTIIMYDGTEWTDNVTLPGWYACVSDNAAHGCPDLVGKFLLGRTQGDAATTGGASTVTLSVSNLALHTHRFDHSHGSHSHVSSPHNHTMSGLTYAPVLPVSDITTSMSNVKITIGDHTHTIDVHQPEFSELPEYRLVSGSDGNLAGYDLTPHYTTTASQYVTSGDQIVETLESSGTIAAASLGFSGEINDGFHQHIISGAAIGEGLKAEIDFSSGEISQTVAEIQAASIDIGFTSPVLTDPVGLGDAFSIIPPYYSVLYIRMCDTIV